MLRQFRIIKLSGPNCFWSNGSLGSESNGCIQRAADLIMGLKVIGPGGLESFSELRFLQRFLKVQPQNFNHNEVWTLTEPFQHLGYFIFRQSVLDMLLCLDPLSCG
ncbi:hypothetical protein XENORESO_004397 [Xenotaenia resolanae]|uniref:Uncharacterized protein n=1 Tax=Xenotaenia resolanae TaxID=208358 RepID=A0ABV0VNU4_9TELE